MGPLSRNEISARKTRRLAAVLVTLLFTPYTTGPCFNRHLGTLSKTRYNVTKKLFNLQPAGDMETGSGSCLTSEEATRLGDEAAAAAAASSNSGPVSGNGSLPATSGFVQTANPPIPHSERSTLIRINRDLKNKPTVLGGGGNVLFLLRHGKLPLFRGWEGKKICSG